MKPADVRSEIARLNAELLRHDLAIEVNGSVIQRRGGRTLVGWPRTGSTSLSGLTDSSVQEYRNLLAAREYTALLMDGALIQISHIFEGDTLISQRFCYYPCPLILDTDGFDAEFSELFDLYLAEELATQSNLLGSKDNSEPIIRLRLRGPLRFEYDAPNARKGHPASHLHVLSPDVRWPVFAPLSIGHFIRFICGHWYSSRDLELFRTWPMTHFNRTISPEEEGELFIECRQPLNNA